MALPTEWQDFVNSYREDDVYWYFPKGTTADTDDFRERFRVFQTFEGRRWTPAVQQEFLDALHKAGLSKAQDTAFTRILKRAFENLGLCWVAANEPIRLTPSGRTYLTENGRSRVLDLQVWRYQLPNPLNDAARGIALFPHVVLVEIILDCDGHITDEEFVLFIARTKHQSEIEDNVTKIKAWRSLSSRLRGEVLSELRKSRYRTISQNSGFSLAFHHCDLLLERPHGRLTISSGQIDALTRRLAQHKENPAPIEFESEADCIAFYGNIENQPLQIAALDYYVDRSNVRKAVEVYAKLPRQVRGEMTVEEFERSQFLERDLEDYLEGNLEQIEVGLKLEGRGRQYSTTVGPIDLFARAKNGDLVVIELKKGRAADQVFGQVCRYMGCIKSEYAQAGQAVRGIIVGREVDTKLQYATKAVPEGLVTLATFEQGKTKRGEHWIRVALV